MIHREQRQALGGEEDFVLEDRSMKDDGRDVIRGGIGSRQGIVEVKLARSPRQSRRDKILGFGAQDIGVEHAHARSL